MGYFNLVIFKVRTSEVNRFKGFIKNKIYEEPQYTSEYNEVLDLLSDYKEDKSTKTSLFKCLGKDLYIPKETDIKFVNWYENGGDLNIDGGYVDEFEFLPTYALGNWISYMSDRYFGAYAFIGEMDDNFDWSPNGIIVENDNPLFKKSKVIPGLSVKRQVYDEYSKATIERDD